MTKKEILEKLQNDKDEFRLNYHITPAKGLLNDPNGLVEKDGKYYAVTGTKGYRWMESEMVRTLEKEDDVDLDYYNKLTNEAIKSIIAYGDYEWFVSNRPYTPPPFSGGVLIGMNAPVYKEEVTFN